MPAKPKSQIATPFGRKAGRMLAPSEVVSGRACGCICRGCGADLIARKGPKNPWHFAHHRKGATRSCFESTIHAAAKQVLLEENWLSVPEKAIQVAGLTKRGAPHTKLSVMRSARIIRFDRSIAEVWETNLRPDVVGYRGDKRLLVEMFFTHKVDEAKLSKLARLGIPALEIDLSNLTVTAGFDAVRERVLQDVLRKTWLVYPGEAEAIAELQAELDAEIREIDRKDDLRVSAIPADILEHPYIQGRNAARRLFSEQNLARAEPER
jgi:hypothetical protein